MTIEQIAQFWPIVVVSVTAAFFVVKLWVENFGMKKFATKHEFENLNATFNVNKADTSTKLTEITGQFKLIDERMQHIAETNKMQMETIISKVDHLNSSLKISDNGERKLMMEALMKFIDREDPHK